MLLFKKPFVLLFLTSIPFFSCNMFAVTLKVQVPNDFVGWCYVIPANDSLGKSSPMVDGKYKVDADGVVIIPTWEFDVRENHVQKVYDRGVEISHHMRYAGSVRSTRSTESAVYNYIHFYLPSRHEWKIGEADQYWRDNLDKYTIEKYRFDSLRKAGRIVF